MPIDIAVMKAVNEENAARAAEVQARLDQHSVLGLNMMSSPGSGKTTLLEATIKRFAQKARFAVIEGDVFTNLDAERIASLGVPAVQVNTEGSCHMTAHMVLRMLDELPLSELDVLVIENIGNLICPAGFELGEHKRIALLSTPEGPDKVTKYPKLFTTSHAVIITKQDLAVQLNYPVEEVVGEIKRLNPKAAVFLTSCVTGEGIEKWCIWLQEQLPQQ